MSALWVAVLAGSAGCFGLKYAGHRVPESLLAGERLQRILGLLPLSLLAGLAAVQTFAAGGGLQLDARLPAVVVAGVLLWRRAPFIVVVVAAAAVAACLRLITG